MGYFFLFYEVMVLRKLRGVNPPGRSKVPVNGPVLKSRTLHQSVLKYLVSFNMVTHVVCFRITVAMITKYWAT